MMSMCFNVLHKHYSVFIKTTSARKETDRLYSHHRDKRALPEGNRSTFHRKFPLQNDRYKQIVLNNLCFLNDRYWGKRANISTI